MIDQTESVTKKSYKVMMNSLLMFLPLFNIGEEKIHSSVVTFAANPEVRIHFNEAYSKSFDLLKQALMFMKDNDKLGKPTRTDKAIKVAGMEVFNETNGDRSNAPDVSIVLTDGKTHDDSEPFSEVLKPIKVKVKAESNSLKTFFPFPFFLPFSINQSNHFLTHLLTHQPVYLLFIHSSIRLLLVRPFIHPFIHSFICSFICSFFHSFLHSIIN